MSGLSERDPKAFDVMDNAEATPSMYSVMLAEAVTGLTIIRADVTVSALSVMPALTDIVCLRTDATLSAWSVTVPDAERD